MSEVKELYVPVVATRGVIVFPGQDVMIEVGRKKSVTAIEDSMDNFEGHVWLVCQNDIMVDNPKEESMVPKVSGQTSFRLRRIQT